MDYKIAVFTLCRDRIAYSQQSFASLAENAGYPFSHYVVNNGSEDATYAWLLEYKQGRKQATFIISNKQNVGISVGSNQVLDHIHVVSGRQAVYDLIIKCDNDIEIVTPDILPKIIEIYKELGDSGAVLSPRVSGITHQPTRGKTTTLAGHPIGHTAIVGGLFHCYQARYYQQYRYPESLPKAWGQDDDFCHTVKQKGHLVGYIEDIVVEHRDGTAGQFLLYPTYFDRKWQEEKEVV